MTTTPLVLPELVIRGLSATDKVDATHQLAERLYAAGRVTDLDGFLADVAARETQMSTGLPGGIGIPHCRSAFVTEPSVAVGLAPAGVDFGAPDGPATLIFLIAAPDGEDQAHLAILASLARKLIHTEFRESLISADSDSLVSTIINTEVAPK